MLLFLPLSALPADAASVRAQSTGATTLEEGRPASTGNIAHLAGQQALHALGVEVALDARNQAAAHFRQQALT
jgi:hypothetical protein